MSRALVHEGYSIHEASTHLSALGVEGGQRAKLWTLE
jgi:hypothetical protein